MHEHEGLAGMIVETVIHAVEISLLIFLMMILVDYVNLWTQGRLGKVLRRGRIRQVTASTALGVLPGCVGSFMAVTLYLRGMLGFGPIVGNMTASCGDAALMMMASFPQTAFGLFALLFGIGLVFAFLSDAVARRLGFIPRAECEEFAHHVEEEQCCPWPESGVGQQLRHMHPLRLLYLVVLLAAGVGVVFGVLGSESWDWVRVFLLLLIGFGLFVVSTVPDHYLIEHIGRHIARHHLPKIFAWTLGTLLVLGLLQQFVDLKGLVGGQTVFLLLAAAGIGMIPDSGPQLLFVFLYAQGVAPFSVLLVNSIVQDGHGLLPLMSVSLRDALLVKVFKLVGGLALGFVLAAFGL